MASDQSGYSWMTTVTTPEHRARVVKFARNHRISVAAFMRAALSFAMDAKAEDLAGYLPPRRRLALEPGLRGTR